jgi:hypothetical protein
MEHSYWQNKHLCRYVYLIFSRKIFNCDDAKDTLCTQEKSILKDSIELFSLSVVSTDEELIWIFLNIVGLTQ